MLPVIDELLAVGLDSVCSSALDSDNTYQTRRDYMGVDTIWGWALRSGVAYM